MVDVAYLFMLVVAIVLLIPSLVLLLEALASTLSPLKIEKYLTKGEDLNIAVLIPAHDEETTIGGTVRLLRCQLKSRDNLIVVADNCRDKTAEEAFRAGATVTVRSDLQRIGKGYALAHGISYLSKSPPDVLIIIDADCRVSEGGVLALASRANALLRPIQAKNVVVPDVTDPKAKISSFAFCFKNIVRARGANRLGLPCHLMGTGMALPWPIVQRLQFGTGEIVEDLRLGFDCVAAGFNPVLCSSVSVSSLTPPSSDAAIVQRTRWEHGHLSFIASNLSYLLLRGLREKNLGLVFMCLDAAVPPLSLLVFLQFGAAIFAAVIALITGIVTPLTVSVLGLCCTLIAVAIGWMTECRGILSLAQVAKIPGYILWKLPVYLGLLLKREAKWIRTKR